jgi:predicted Zn-dependent protease
MTQPARGAGAAVLAARGVAAADHGPPGLGTVRRGAKLKGVEARSAYRIQSRLAEHRRQARPFERPFAYRFRWSTGGNAFALPGGHIFVSRGLLALANDEDELACVIGHEIGHVAKRHAAAQQGAARGRFPLQNPWLRAGQMAAYSRDLERSADHDGQILCAAAGYDPRGLARFSSR